MRRALVATIVVLACACGAGDPRAPAASPASSPSPTLAGSALPEAAAPSASVGALPQGAGDAAITSAPVPSAPPASRPTPTPDPAVWRFEGRVVDPDGKAVQDVCVVIGPHGCQRGSPRSDDRGVYFIDMPQVPSVVYDLYFVKDGYVAVWHRVQPTEPAVFNVVLRRPRN